MRKFVEKIVIGVLSVALVLAVLGLVLSLRVLANAALVILMIAAVAFSVIQIAEYLCSMRSRYAPRKTDIVGDTKVSVLYHVRLALRKGSSKTEIYKSAVLHGTGIRRDEQKHQRCD